jgi:hypothetical protein
METKPPRLFPLLVMLVIVVAAIFYFTGRG